MRLRLSATAAAALFLAACATSAELAPTPQEEALAADLQSRSIVPSSAAEREAIERQDPLTQAAFWAEAYDLNPGDREAAFKLSTVLRGLSNSGRAAEVARQALALHREDGELLTAYGLALVASGNGVEAIETLNRARRATPGDWRVVNALGVALDQAGRPADARARFEEALLMSGGAPAVLNNLALAHMLDGDPEEAEALLRRAAAQDGAPAETRQNLAIALALQGRFDEAEAMALVDASPDMTEQSLAYVQALMSTGRSYDRLRAMEQGLR